MSPAEALRTPHARILVALTLLAMALRAPFIVWVDTWYNLVLGREIARAGLVTHNLLTEQGFGIRCVDQQWLAHAIYFGIEKACGLVGVVLLAASITAASFVSAVVFAFARGATPGRTLGIGILALGVVSSQTVARAQTLALPFMVAFVWVLAKDARRSSRAAWWLVPCAVAWANLHGSVLLAPAMGVLLLVGRMVDCGRRHEAIAGRSVLRDALLAAALSAAVFVSPYAGKLPSYYWSTVANPAFRAHLTEWQPPSSIEAPGAVLLCAVVLLLLRRAIPVTSTFEASLASLLAVASLLSVRHAMPLALTAAALVPRWADAALGRFFRIEPDRALGFLARLLIPIAAVSFAVIPIAFGRSIRAEMPVAFTDRVASASASGLLLVDEAHADRLLWFHPELRGRVSHDARVETIPVGFLEALASFYGAPDAPPFRRLLARYDEVVVDRRLHARWFDSMSRDSGWRQIAADGYASAFVRREGAHPPDP